MSAEKEFYEFAVNDGMVLGSPHPLNQIQLGPPPKGCEEESTADTHTNRDPKLATLSEDLGLAKRHGNSNALATLCTLLGLPSAIESPQLSPSEPWQRRHQ